LGYLATPRTVGAENLRHQVIFVNHVPGAIAPLDPELIQIRDAVARCLGHVVRSREGAERRISRTMISPSVTDAGAQENGTTFRDDYCRSTVPLADPGWPAGRVC
jgi:hypothetical protein